MFAMYVSILQIYVPRESNILYELFKHLMHVTEHVPKLISNYSPVGGDEIDPHAAHQVLAIHSNT